MNGGETLEIEGGRRLEGLVIAPPDKSITHRALLLAALGEGTTRVAPLGRGRDNRATRSALASLGVRIELEPGEGGAIVEGKGGPLGLIQPKGPIDCENSGTTMRVLAGILAASRLDVTLIGDGSLMKRPMSRLLVLEAMGARIGGRDDRGKIYPPITVRGAPLKGREHHLEVASAQVKTALILAGLWAEGDSTIHEPMRSRDHTERMLRRLGASIAETPDGAIRVRPIDHPWRAGEIAVAPDLSSAAFFIGIALVTASERLFVETGVNPTRAGFLDALERMGARLVREPRPPVFGEPVERIRVECDARDLAGITIGGELALRALDELPLLAGIAAFARGRTIIKDAAELRVKESDRISATHALLSGFGARSTQTADGLIIDGDPERLRGFEVDPKGDHRIAMTAAVIGLAVPGTTRIGGAEQIEVSFPRFREELERLGAGVR